MIDKIIYIVSSADLYDSGLYLIMGPRNYQTYA